MPLYTHRNVSNFITLHKTYTVANIKINNTKLNRKKSKNNGV